MNKITFQYMIYPLSLSLGVTFVYDVAGIFEKISEKTGIYLLGIITMWLSWLLVYVVFLQKNKENKL